MSVKNPLTVQNYLNIRSPSTIVDVTTKKLDKHSYDNVSDNKNR